MFGSYNREKEITKTLTKICHHFDNHNSLMSYMHFALSKNAETLIGFLKLSNPEINKE